MGLFSTVRIALPCLRCGSPYPADVQFKTGEDWDLPVYESGDPAPRLQPGECYEGIADSFCEGCLARWRIDEKLAAFEEFARRVEAGAVAARFATYRADPDHLDLGRQLRVLRDGPLSPAEVRALAEKPEPPVGWMNIGARLLDAEVVLFQGGIPLDDAADLRSFWTSYLQNVERRLAAAGWSHDAFREDLSVRIDAGGHITVAVL